jgi:hypothetical protein
MKHSFVIASVILSASIFSSSMVRAQTESEASVPVTTCSDAEKRKQELDVLVNERKEAFIRLQERAQLPKTLELVMVLGSAYVGVTTGIGVGGQLSQDDNLVMIGYGLSSIGWLAIAGSVITNLFVDHRAEDIAAIDATQKKIDERMMQN